MGDRIFENRKVYRFNPNSGGILDVASQGVGVIVPTPSRSPQNTVKKQTFF